jgi:hypothetical protein
MNRPDPLAMIAKMAQGERKLADVTFMAPVTAGGAVRVRVQGVVYELKVDVQSQSDWALLKCTSPGCAEIVGSPSLKQISEYLKLLPRVRMILLEEFNGSWWGVQASAGDKNFQVAGAVPLNSVRAGAAFDTIHVRFDGARFWYDSADRKRDPVVGRTLRTALSEDIAPETVRAKGMTPQELVAYKILWLSRHPDTVTTRHGSPNDRIRTALQHGGAFLDAFWSSGENQTTVRFLVDGETHTVTVRSDTLSVVSAGICLSGQDDHFDLTSLVGVLREYKDDHW